MVRKVSVEVSTLLVINIEEGVELCEVIKEMDYSFTERTPGSEIIDNEIVDYKVIIPGTAMHKYKNTEDKWLS